MGAKTLRVVNVMAGLVFFGFAVRLTWKLAQGLR
jgi:hypothetical protein